MTSFEMTGAPSRVSSRLIWLVAVPAGFALIGMLIRLIAVLVYHPDAGIAGYFGTLCRWDCHWYVDIAEIGYDPYPNVPKMSDGGNWAFFPLYPALIGVLRLLFPFETIVTASLVSIVLAGCAAAASYPLFDGNKRAYVLFTAFLLSGPFSIYFTTFYTEVLFVLLTILVFVLLRQSNYLAAGAFAALLSGTRIVGVFIVFAILIQAYLDHRARGGTLKTFLRDIWLDTDVLLAVFMAPLGLFAYMAFLHFHMGDALAFAHVQVAWARQTASPLAHWWNAVTTMRADWEGIISTAQSLALAVAFGYVLTAILFLRRQFAAAAFCAICITLPLFAGMASMLRFIVALAPLMILAAQIFSRTRWLFVLSLIGLFVFCYLTTGWWLQMKLVLV